MPGSYMEVIKQGKTILHDKYIILIIIISTVFTALFIVYSYLDYALVNTTAWDLGIYMQVLHSAITGHLFYTNLLGESYLAEHFSPVLFLLVIPYYFFPSAYTLLTIQAMAIGFSAIILFFLSRNILSRIYPSGPRYLNGSFISLIISTAYIMSPLTESPVFFDYHLMTFLPLFFFLALYSYVKGKFWINLIFLALLVSIHSSFVFIALMTILMELFMNRTLSIYSKKSNLHDISVFIVAGIALSSYFLLASLVKADISGTTNITTGISITGSVGPLTLLRDMIYKPNFIAYLLISSWYLKLLIMAFALGGFAFLFIRYPPSIFTFVPYILYAMFSVYRSYYSIGYQYTMLFIPMAAFAAVMGFYMLYKNKKSVPKFKIQAKIAIVVIIAIAFIGLSVATPIVSGYSFDGSLPNEIHEYTDNKSFMKVKFEHTVANSIGKNAYIVTGNGLFTLFGNDPNAIAFPYTQSIVIHGYYYQYLIENTHNSGSYANTTIDGQAVSLNSMEEKYISSGDYSIYAEGYGIIVLEKYYQGNPKYT